MNALEINPGQFELFHHILTHEEESMAKRMRVVFTLRSIGGARAISILKDALKDPSALLSHEAAYCLGQMQDIGALNYLIDTVMDENLNVMVRHEAAEALGALGDVRALSVLEKFRDSEIQELSETCEVAIQLIKWRLKHGAIKVDGPFTTFDPAPPSKSKNFNKLKTGLLNSNLSTFKRYKMLFALRNINTRQSALAICAAFGTGSSLFEHELAYVLGQMAFKVTAPTLAAVLEDTAKHEMVRHEAAEALGSIADKSSLSVLQKHAQDDIAVVKESCIVALDLHNYYNSDKIQYADGLSYADTRGE